jgi:hypothetical protein
VEWGRSVVHSDLALCDANPCRAATRPGHRCDERGSDPDPKDSSRFLDPQGATAGGVPSRGYHGRRRRRPERRREATRKSHLDRLRDTIEERERGIPAAKGSGSSDSLWRPDVRRSLARCGTDGRDKGSCQGGQGYTSGQRRPNHRPVRRARRCEGERPVGFRRACLRILGRDGHDPPAGVSSTASTRLNPGTTGRAT